MNNIIKKITVAFLALFTVSATVAPFATVFAATFNNNSQDYATVQVSNYTRNPGSNSNWSNAASASAGEVVSFLVYYHNTAADTAKNTRIRLQLPSGAFTSRTVTGSVWSDNATAVTGSGTITLSSNQTLTFIPGSVSWYANQSSTAQPLLSGQSGNEIVSSNGLLIGDIATGWETQGYVVFRARVSSGGQTNGNTTVTTNARSPYVTTKAATSVYANSALFRGAASGNGSLTTTWFEYGNTSSLGSKSTVQSIGQAWSSTSYTATMSGLQNRTRYYYRAVAQNEYGTVYGKIVSITTAGSVATTPSPEVVVKRATTVKSNTAIANRTTSVLLTPSLNNKQLNAGDTFVYTIEYVNNTNAALANAQLNIVFPAEVAFIESDVTPTTISDNTLTYAVGTIGARTSGVIDITFTLDEAAKTDDALSINAVLDHTNTYGDVQTTSAFLTFIVHNGVAGLASLTSVLGAFLGNWFIDLLLGLLIGFGIYHFFIRQKEDVLIS